MNEVKAKAMELRSQGLTYREIQQSLGKNVPKSTLSYWFRGIILSNEQTERISNLARDKLVVARQAALLSNKRALQIRAARSLERAHEFVGDVSDRDAKLALALLYLGEGGKYPGTRGLYLGSSDPRIVNLYIQLLARCYGIKTEDLKCSVYHRADQDMKELVHFWSESTGIPIANFYPSRPDARTINKPTRNAGYKGVAHVYHKGVDAQIELDHIADALLDATRPVQKRVSGGETPGPER